MPLLDVNNLVTKFYTEDGIVHAVNGISYTLDEGEAIGIVGESGSGKSVGVKSLIGLIPQPPGKIESGEVFFEDQDLLSLSERELAKVRGRKITMIFQDPMTSLNPVLTIERQMIEGLQLHYGMEKDKARKRAVEMLSLVGIVDGESRLKSYPHQFSGGQRQRIMIAMALTTNPSLLIADEPTTALDVTIQAQIVELVTGLRQKLGMAIIWITHDLALVAGMVDKVIVMYGGYVVESALTRDLYKHTSHPYTLGLLQSLPDLEASGDERLVPIPGAPPDLTIMPTGCSFAPRCRYAIDRCWNEIPELVEVGSKHHSACFRAEEVRNGVAA
jgi:oligopeptide transport system ATP-binding protein